MEENRCDSQTEQTSLEVPPVVIVYGLIIMVLSAINIGLMVIFAFLCYRDILALSGCAIYFLISLVWFRIGKGLKDGERSAVYGICIFCGITFVVCLASFFLFHFDDLAAGDRREFVVELLLLWIIIVLYIPLIVSAFKHWGAFTKSGSIKKKQIKGSIIGTDFDKQPFVEVPTPLKNNLKIGLSENQSTSSSNRSKPESDNHLQSTFNSRDHVTTATEVDIKEMNKKPKINSYIQTSTYSECPICLRRYSQSYNSKCETCGFDFAKSTPEYL